MRAEYVQVPEAIRSCLLAIRHTLFFLLLSHSGSLSSLLQYRVNATISESRSFDFMP